MKLLLDAFGAASPQVRALIGASVHRDLVRCEAAQVDNARRAVRLLGQAAVVAAWLRNAVDSAGDEEAAPGWNFWAWQIVADLLEDRDVSWSMILDLLSAADDDEALGVVAAGPLEDWVKGHAVETIDRIEREADGSDRFRAALGGIWVWSDLPDETFERDAAAARSRLDAPSTPEEAAARRANTARFIELCAIADDESLNDSVREEAWQQAMDL